MEIQLDVVANVTGIKNKQMCMSYALIKKPNCRDSLTSNTVFAARCIVQKNIMRAYWAESSTIKHMGQITQGHENDHR